jgi:hypothetical protein
MLNLAGLWSRLARAVGAITSWAARNPAWALCLALTAACGLIWHEYDVKSRQVAKLASEITAFRTAQDTAKQIAVEALHHQEAVYQAKAQDADHAYTTQLADAHSAADRYIATHRVQPAPAGNRASPTIAAASGGSAIVPAIVPTDTVLVSSGDVQQCTDAATYALNAHRWAESLTQIGANHGD